MFTMPIYTGRNSISLSSVPMDVTGVQVQSDGSTYEELRKEAKKYCELLQKKFPDYQKYDCRFTVKRCNHDFGTYFEVEIEYEEADFDEEFNDSTEFALFVESNLPYTWQDTKVLKFAPEKDEEIPEAQAIAI